MEESQERTPPVPEKPQQTAPLLRALMTTWLRRFENALFVISIVLVSAYFVLQLPAVQNWLVGKTTAYLSDELGTKVVLNRVDIEFFDKVVLEGLYIEDLNGDTLLYAQKLSAGLNGNFFSILWDRLEFSEISLVRAHFHLRRTADQRRNNMSALLHRLGELFGSSNTEKPNKGGPAFIIKIQNLNLRDFWFSEHRYNFSDGLVKGKMISFRVAEGNIKVNQVDSKKRLIDLHSASLEGLRFDFEKTAQKPPEGFKPYIKPRPNKTDTLDLDPVLQIAIGQLALRNSAVRFDNFRSSPQRATPDAVMDYDHIFVKNVTMQAENVVLHLGEKAAVDEEGLPSSEDILDITGQIRHFSATEQCGFAIAHGEAGQLMLTDTITALYNARLETYGGSSVGDTLVFRYADGPEDDPWTDIFSEFSEKVHMEINLATGSKINLGDVRHFDEVVFNNEFFIGNKDLVADVSGTVSGKLNSKLKADNLDIRVGSSTRLRGEFNGRGLGDNGEPTILMFDFEELLTDMNTIARLVPRFRPPAQFFKLDKIAFKGSYQLFDGFDHVIYGQFVTSLGPGELDMQLNLKDGPEKAVYRGDLNIRGFDMAAWTGDRDFGPCTFNVHVDDNSTGLTLPTINARVGGRIDTFFYKKYPYRDIKLNGKFEKNVFDGKVVSDDPNVDFVFDGTINFKDTIPVFDFKANVRRLDLGVLQLVEQDWVLFCDVKELKLKGNNLDQLIGTATIDNFKILEDRENWYSLDYIRFNSYFRPDGTRYLGLDSDIAYGQMIGDYSIATAPNNLLRLYGKYHPAFARKLGLPSNDSLPIKDNYDLYFQVRNSRNLAQLFVPGLDTLRDLTLSASVNARRGTSYFVAQTPLVRYKNMQAHDPILRWSSEGDSAWVRLHLPQNSISQQGTVPSVSLGGTLVGDVFHVRLEAKDGKPGSAVEKMFLDGDLTVVDSVWQLSFNPSKINLFSQEWLIEEDNYFRFSNNYIETKQLELFNGFKRIELESLQNGRGIKFNLTNFDLSEINHFLDEDQVQFRGRAYDFEVRVHDVFLMRGMEIGFLTDTLFVNEKPYGEVLSNLEMENLNSPLTGKIFLLEKQTKKQLLRVAVNYLINGEEGEEQTVAGTDIVLRPGEFDAEISANQFPFEVLEAIVPEISQTSGKFSAQLKASGDAMHPLVQGQMEVHQGQFQIDYLKTLFHIKNQPISFTKNRIWAEGDTIFDATKQHFALVHGGLEHEHFNKWRLNCRIESKDPAFLVMNTNLRDNDLYYGRAEGRFSATFSGSFERTNISIEATTGSGTRLYIPLYNTADAQETPFINFEKNKPKPESRKDKSPVISELKGLNLEMDLTVTDQAEIQLIFDEKTGDIIKGRGEGNIRLAINREGEFSMYGSYQIVRGEYLFTLLNFVNKPFVVTQGGTINWYGDPYGAQINLDATYELSTSVFNFVKEELELLRNARPRLLDEAGKATRVMVLMHLAGDLLQPNISFSLQFPYITSELKSLTDNKLRQLRQDQAELSRQVFGLVVIGSFLPPSGAGASFIQSSDYVATAFNTLTQMISTQFSTYLAGLATEWFGGAVSNIDFDIIYSDYQNADLLSTDPTKLGGREVNVRFSSGFVNDRVTVELGSQFGISRTGLSTYDGFLGEDVTIQIALTENRQWRMKVYQRTEPDASGQRALRFGLGLSFQKDYDTFEDMWKSIFKQKRRK